MQNNEYDYKEIIGRNDKVKQNKRKKYVEGTLSATVVLILVAVILVVVGYFYLFLKNGYTIDELIDNIVGNLIGVLAAFLLFDILYNKMTQDAYAKETSQQITKTLIGDPDTLDAFSDEDKMHLCVSTIRSITKDEDAVSMMTGNMGKYFDKVRLSRIRKHFNYSINLTTEFPHEYNDLPGVKDNEYFYVQEKLDYDVKYLSGKDKNLSTNEVRIGFSFDKRFLDAGLLETSEDEEFARCIFNENLEISKKAITYIKGLSGDELYTLIKNTFNVVVRIDGNQGDLKKVDIRERGIIAIYNVDYLTDKDEHSVRILFHMPKLWNSIFEVVLVDPTKDPKVLFDYMPNKMDVTMYSYLNKGEESNEGAYEQQNGLYDIDIKDEWIFPKSGIVFYVRKKSAE